MSLPRFVTILALAAAPALAAEPSFTFRAIDGGSYDSAEWRGKPVLVVNTASLCGFAPQLADLQALSDAYAGRAVVLAVPSDDFNQELASESEVKEFCAVNYDLTLPMTGIEHVAKGEVHPFYAWVKAEHGFTPGWNFNKVLIGPDGEFIKGWGAVTNPGSAAITSEIDALLK
ncbi:MAG: glutathione peroxidase [Rhodobacteraceae bacterium]|nr:glutathione peroxidase [Paracoccaceae bacterium]